MSDRLILSAPKSDGDADKIAQHNALEDSKKRTAQLERNIADLEAVLKAQLALAAAAKAGGGTKIGARKHAKFRAVSTAPSINKTPAGCAMVPVAYPLVQDLSNSVGVASNVWFNDCQVYTLDSSKQPKCTGDKPGTGGGIRSGTVSGEVKPTGASATVWAQGKRVVRDGDACTMNKGNTPGVYVTAPATSSAPPADAIKTSNPPYPAAAREHAATSDGTNTSPTGAPQATGSWLQPDPFAGPEPRTQAEKLDAMLMKERLSGAGPSHGVPTVLDKSKLGPRFESYDPAAEQHARLRTTNSLSMALLGPFGAPGAAARLSGADEKQVAAANEVGAAAMGVAWAGSGIQGKQTVSVAPRVISSTGTAATSSGGVQIVGTGTNATKASSSESFAHSAEGPFSLLNQEARPVSFNQFVQHVKDNGLTNSFSKPLSQVYDTVYAVPKAQRPSPESYLKPEFMDQHTKIFSGGAARVDSTAAFDKRYGRDIEAGLPFGRPDAVFTSPSSLIDRLYSKGDPAMMENTLGFDPGTFSGAGSMTRTYIDSPKDVGLRFASGAEGGANSLWVRGGYTHNTTGGPGLPEMVTNQLPSPSTNNSIRVIK